MYGVIPEQLLSDSRDIYEKSKELPLLSRPILLHYIFERLANLLILHTFRDVEIPYSHGLTHYGSFHDCPCDLREQDVKTMASCVQINRDCANICWTASQFMSRDSQYSKQIRNVCADICETCAKECEQYADMDHCQKCAQVCRRCAEECRKI